MILRGSGRLNTPHCQRAPVSIEILESCFASLDLLNPQTKRYGGGVLCQAFVFLLRRPEIVATSGARFQWFALKDQEVAVTDANGAATEGRDRAHMPQRSKTNQGGAPTARMMTRSDHSHLCPVLGTLLLKQSRRGLLPDIPVAFTNASGHPCCVSATRVSSAIRDAARAIGEDPTRFGTPSLRAGGATNMYRAGIDTLTTPFHGRWTSDAVKLYTRLCSELVSAISTKVVSGAKGSTVLQ
ncbi:uncharacterized protein IUM83_02252 [Phytophthora cinnamomi]|uniref:uncharacterized protein n=1 Tax=Phytophthora cinnamomi TaxID=4785 RepID=UPI00355AC17A|nr:hypothetical protein IUM83_02252 [Phytophthora cinnamomi]